MKQNKINKISIEGETIHLKKGFMGWNVITPYKNEDGSINWFNLLTGGSWKRLIIMIFVVLVILGAIYEYTTNISTLVGCFDNPVALQICKESFGYQEIILNP